MRIQYPDEQKSAAVCGKRLMRGATQNCFALPRPRRTVRPMVGKPVVFFSHSSRDKRELALLKQLFLEKTGGTVEVFLSSDGQSIPLGRNWVHRIEEALGEAKLLVTFITENSIGSSWVSFEAGFAYSKGVRVVPVGFLGLDIAKVPPPLGLLQGFNIGSADGLDNLIALINDDFEHQHRSRFTEDEYLRIVGTASTGKNEEESRFTMLVDEIDIKLPGVTKAEGTARHRAEATAKLLSPEAIFSEWRGSARAVFHGGYVTVPDEGNPGMVVDPRAIACYTEKLGQLQLALGCGDGPLTTNVRFIEGVRTRDEQHKASARLMDCGIKLDGRMFRFGPFLFFLYQGTESARLETTHSGPSYPLNDLEELIELLFEREVLVFDRPTPW